VARGYRKPPLLGNDAMPAVQGPPPEQGIHTSTLVTSDGAFRLPSIPQCARVGEPARVPGGTSGHQRNLDDGGHVSRGPPDQVQNAGEVATFRWALHS
jgi:hypothetical protein